jgi:hypothetical protein
VKSSIETDDPNRASPKTEIELLRRPNERKASELPNCKKSSTDIEEPNLLTPNVDTELPIQAKERKDSELPK